MTSLDLLLLIVGVAIVVYATFTRTLGVAFFMVGFYLVTLGVGVLTLASDMLYGLGNALMDVIGGRTLNVLLIQSIVFLGLTIPIMVLIHFLIKMAFQDTSLPKLGGLDYILGALLGIVLALLIMAVFCNTWGVIVSVRWQPQSTWNSMMYAYRGSLLRPYLNRVLNIYRDILFPFRFLGGYPPFFVPQR
ncbi:MAG: hypothetical protein JXA33_14455 [Anaerolineae bacterium]|nr:hypothetical protein [Anaerolineae bacterium]